MQRALLQVSELQMPSPSHPLTHTSSHPHTLSVTPPHPHISSYLNMPVSSQMCQSCLLPPMPYSMCQHPPAPTHPPPPPHPPNPSPTRTPLHPPRV